MANVAIGHPAPPRPTRHFVMILSIILAAAIISLPTASADDASIPSENRDQGAIALPNEIDIFLPVTDVQRFVPPPRSIADIASTLDNERPDLQKIERLKARANSSPDQKSGKELAQFYFERGRARSELGRLAESISDGNTAIEIGVNVVSPNLMGRFIQFVSQQYSAAGDPDKALEINKRQLAGANVSGTKGYALGANLKIAQMFVQMGDLEQAAEYIQRNDALIHEARTSPLRGWRTAYQIKGQDWESMVDNGHALLLEARGQFGDAERSYRATELRKVASIKPMLQQENPPSESLMRQLADNAVLNQGRMKARQGRLAEAEVDVRRALMSRLKDVGKFNPVTVNFIRGFAEILIEEGRFEDAEKLTRSGLDINRTTGVASDASSNAQLLSQLGSILNLQHRNQDAVAVYAALDDTIAHWEPHRREAFENNRFRILSLYDAGRLDEGIYAAKRLLASSATRFGNTHFDTASARGVLAEGYFRAGQSAAAIREFKTAIPMMIALSREIADDDNTTGQAARAQQLQDLAESYFSLLSVDIEQRQNAGAETFALADAIRAGSVQRALAASSARSAANDPALGVLVRKEQDIAKQLNAQLGALNNALSLSADNRDEQLVQRLSAAVRVLRTENAQVRQEIDRNFPAYAELVSPRSPSVEEVRRNLADDEAMVSFFFGRRYSFAWSFAKAGPVEFVPLTYTSSAIADKVGDLRTALEPTAAMISDIPPFDVKLGYELYFQLLKPIENGWKKSRSLIVVTNGALGLLPLSLLPTAEVALATSDDPLFSNYRAVPWLARTHAVTLVPSAAALRVLRQLPAGKQGRSELVAFGDPIFDAEDKSSNSRPIKTADAAGAVNVSRGLPLKRRNSPAINGVDSADIAMLPRLPDTADELRSIALALNADPSTALFLGKNASEQTVKTMDLSGFKLLAFATHGLVPGELNGLTQPALALSSPLVTGKDGDGLLTMEEILALRLDADWVVLSACNTGTGAGAGAEAASGLGRAFFYAGTRALLVTNWSVHSQSARELITDLFKRQAADARMSRGEALREAMVALMDGHGYVDDAGQTQFAYAHPLFWAPYSIIGDGGRR